MHIGLNNPLLEFNLVDPIIENKILRTENGRTTLKLREANQSEFKLESKKNATIKI